MSIRLVTLIKQTTELPRVEHFHGLPPEMTGGTDFREKLSWPRVLLIKETSDGIFLFRYTEEGIYSGDTWHTSIDEAKEQAEYEYGNLLTGWQEVPLNIDDPVAFAIKQT